MHEALSVPIEQPGALATHRLTHQHHVVTLGTASFHEGGRVKLHELQVAQLGSCTIGERQPVSSTFRRRGRDRVNPPEAASGEQHRTGLHPYLVPGVVEDGSDHSSAGREKKRPGEGSFEQLRSALPQLF